MDADLWERFGAHPDRAHPALSVVHAVLPAAEDPQPQVRRQGRGQADTDAAHPPPRGERRCAALLRLTARCVEFPPRHSQAGIPPEYRSSNSPGSGGELPGFPDMSPAELLREPLHVISGVWPSRGAGLPAGEGRWHILFGGRQRPLLMPVGKYELQKRGLPYFIGGRLRTLYAMGLLKLNALVPAFGLLPEFEARRLKDTASRNVSSAATAWLSDRGCDTNRHQGATPEGSALFLSENGEGWRWPRSRSRRAPTRWWWPRPAG